jgi:hypothetical protein
MNKGGRAKKASYETVVMRIPQPLQEEVHRMVEQFHASLNTNKPVTGIEVRAIDKPVTGIEVRAIDKPVTGIEVRAIDKPVTGIEDPKVLNCDSGSSVKSASHDIKSKRIDSLKLPTRIFHILGKANLNTIGDLLYYSELDLYEIKGLGGKGVEQLKIALLQEVGITLAK